MSLKDAFPFLAKSISIEGFQKMIDSVTDTASLLFVATGMSFLKGSEKFEQQIIDKLETMETDWVMVVEALPDIWAKSETLGSRLWEKVISSTDFRVWAEIARRFPKYEPATSKMMETAKTFADWKRVLFYATDGSMMETIAFERLKEARVAELD